MDIFIDDIKDNENNAEIASYGNKFRRKSIKLEDDVIPIVYTRKLDDMLVFDQNLGVLNAKDILMNIDKESKPKLKKKVSYPNFPPFYKKVLFDMLVLKIEEINQKAIIKSETYENESKSPKDFKKSKELKDPFSICKPLSIVLEDIAKTQNTSLNSDITNKSVTVNSKRHLTLIQSNFNTSSLKMTREQRLQDLLNYDNNTKNKINKTNFFNNNNVITINDIYLNKLSLYYFDRLGKITTYYKTTDIINIFNIEEYWDPAFRIENCCWYKRDVNIKTTCNNQLSDTVIRFLSTSHKCKPSACRCCCRIKTGNNDTLDRVPTTTEAADDIKLHVEDIEIKNLEKEIQNIVSCFKKESFSSTDMCDSGFNWLNKILIKNSNKPSFNWTHRNLKQLKQMKGNSKTEKYTNQSNLFKKEVFLQLFIENLATHELEYYECMLDGSILTYTVIVNGQSQLQNAGNSINSIIDTHESKIVISEKVCCWFKREKIASQLIQYNLLPSTIHFIKKNHMCSFGNCTCCCKPKDNEKKKKKLQDIHIPKHGNSTRSLKEMRIHKIKCHCDSEQQNVIGHSCGKNTSYKNVTKLDMHSNIQKQDKNYKNITTFVPEQRQNNKIINPLEPVRSCTDLTPGFTPLKNKININEDFDEIIHKNNINKAPVSKKQEKTIITNSDITNEVTSINENIMNFLENMRVTINEHNNVAVMLDTPISSLSTAELEILATLLSSVQKQVDSTHTVPEINNKSITNMLTTKNSTLKSKVSVEKNKNRSSSNQEFQQNKTVKSTVSVENLIQSFKNTTNNVTSINDKQPMIPKIQNIFSIKETDNNDTKQTMNEPLRELDTELLHDSQTELFTRESCVQGTKRNIIEEGLVKKKIKMSETKCLSRDLSSKNSFSQISNWKVGIPKLTLTNPTFKPNNQVRLIKSDNVQIAQQHKELATSVQSCTKKESVNSASSKWLMIDEKMNITPKPQALLCSTNPMIKLNLSQAQHKSSNPTILPAYCLITPVTTPIVAKETTTSNKAIALPNNLMAATQVYLQMSPNSSWKTMVPNKCRSPEQSQLAACNQQKPTNLQQLASSSIQSDVTKQPESVHASDNNNSSLSSAARLPELETSKQQNLQTAPRNIQLDIPRQGGSVQTVRARKRNIMVTTFKHTEESDQNLQKTSTNIKVAPGGPGSIKKKFNSDGNVPKKF